MSLLDVMKANLKKAMFAHNEVEKNILRVAIGETNQLAMTTQQGNKPVSDEQIAKILRKLLISNNEVLQNTPDGERKTILQTENQILEVLLPSQLTQDEIRVQLQNIQEVVQLPMGKAIGVAMKHFRETNALVDGNDVKSVVESMRGVNAV